MSLEKHWFSKIYKKNTDLAIFLKKNSEKIYLYVTAYINIKVR